MLIYDVILDVGTTGCQQTVCLYQGDDRLKLLCITLLQNGKRYDVQPDQTVLLCACKPDDTTLVKSCSVRGGRIYYLPTAQTTAAEGVVRCQLKIRDQSDAVLFTPEFQIRADATVPAPDVPESASESDAYNWAVLSALSASGDGGSLLFGGEPVGAIRCVSALPETAEENEIVYRIGHGLYRFADDEWLQLTDDGTAVSALADAVEALRADVPTAADAARWDAAADASHTHTNQAVLNALTAPNGKLYLNGVPVGIEIVTTDVLPAGVESGRIVYQAGSTPDRTGFHRSMGNNAWQKLVSENPHSNLSTLAKLSEQSGKALFDGKEIPLIAPDDVSLLGLATYTTLVIRDEAITGASLQDVPVYVQGGDADICGLFADADDPDADYVMLSELRQADTGMPLRILRVQMGGVYAAYFPQAFNGGLSGTVQVGWNRDNQPCSAPTVSAFAPTSFVVGEDAYDDLSDLPDDAASALRSLSQCVNVSAAAMGTIRVPDDAVLRFAGTFDVNRKYAFSTDDDCTFTLPSVPWTGEDAQFVLYLTCTSDVDLTFPQGTLLAGGAPNSDTGSHKLIGSFLRGADAWSVGGVDYEEAT